MTLRELPSSSKKDKLVLWVDAWDLEYASRYEENHLVIQLATHWNLVDSIEFKTINFNTCRGYWRGPRPTTAIPEYMDFEEFRKYIPLCSGMKVELCPESKKEFDRIHAIWDIEPYL